MSKTLTKKDINAIEEQINSSMPPKEDELQSISKGVKLYGLYKKGKTSRIYVLDELLEPLRFLIEGSHSQIKRVMKELTFLNCEKG